MNRYYYNWTQSRVFHIIEKIKHKGIKMRRILFVITVIITIVFWGCEKSPIQPSGDNLTGNLTGKWYTAQNTNAKTLLKSAGDIKNGTLSYWNYKTLITTNSDQKVINYYAEGEGGITVTGTVQTTFKYMMVMDFDFDNDNGTNFVVIQLYNMDLYNMDSDADKPFYMLNLCNSGNGWFTSGLDVYYNDGSSETYYADITFNYDGKQLVINEVSIPQNDGDGNVTISGVLTHTVTDIPANTPTSLYSVDLADAGGDMGGWTIEIKDDGTWLEIYTWEDESETITATWKTEGTDKLIVTYDFPEYVETDNADSLSFYTDNSHSVEFTYSISGNELNLVSETDLCTNVDFPGFTTTSDCYSSFETEFGLDEGSLVAIVDRLDLRFNKVD